MLVRSITQTLKIVSIVAIALIVVSGSVGFFSWWSDREEADNIGRPVTLTITEDDDGSSVAKKLTDTNLVQYGIYFETRFRFSGDELRPGTYTLRHGMSVSEIIKAITVPGDSDPDATAEAPAEAIEVVFIEGQRIEQFADDLVKAGWQGDPKEFIDLAKHPANKGQWDFMKGSPADASYEGFLFPDTYTIPANDEPQNIIDRMLGRFDEVFTDEMQDQADAAGLSTFQVVTLASIVEREAAVEGERSIIAGLYLNRFNSGMILNADPTIQYIFGSTSEWWPKLTGTMIQDSLADPYNTYNQDHPGLPPGPISNPGVRAIQAVLTPDKNDYLYMVAKNDGSDTHVFTDSLSQHEQNICTYDPNAANCN